MPASPTTIEFNGQKYQIAVSIFAPTRESAFTDMSPANKETLLLDSIDSIEIVHDIVNPLLSGKIVYTDNEYAIMKKFQSKPYVYVLVSFGLEKKQASQDIISLERQFSHLFLVNNIQITGQVKQNVTYSIDLISHHWWNFNQSLHYSTGGNEKSVTNILADCYNKSGLTYNTNEFATKASMKYLTSANETLMSAHNYLMHKSYIPRERDGGAIFTIYDWMTNAYNLWRLTDAEPRKRLVANDFIDAIFIPTEQTVVSELLQSQPPKISMANYQPRTDMIKSLFDYHSWAYDYSKGTFNDSSVKTSSIIDNLMNGWKTGYTSRYYDFAATDYRAISNATSSLFKREESEWFNIIDQYQNLISLMINNNVLIVNCDGELRRMPGKNVVIEVDESDDNSLQDFNGSWINLRTRHIITPSSYKTNMILGRIHQ